MKKNIMLLILLVVAFGCKKPQQQVAPVPVPGAQAPAELPANGATNQQPVAAPLPNSTATQQVVQSPPAAAPLLNGGAVAPPPAPVVHSTEGKPSDGQAIGLVELGDQKPATATKKGKKGGKKTVQPPVPTQQQVRAYVPPPGPPPVAYAYGRWTVQISSHSDAAAAASLVQPGQMVLPTSSGGYSICIGKFGSREDAVRYIEQNYGKKSKKKSKNRPFPRQFGTVWNLIP